MVIAAVVDDGYNNGWNLLYDYESIHKYYAIINYAVMEIFVRATELAPAASEGATSISSTASSPAGRDWESTSRCPRHSA